MPRTKAPRKKNSGNENIKIQKPIANKLLQFLENIRKSSVDMAEIWKTEFNGRLSSMIMQQIAKVPNKNVTQTVSEMSSMTNSAMYLSCTSASVSKLMTTTRTTRKRSTSKLVRSNSYNDDEGYRTTESTDGNTGGRRSRQRQPTTARKVSRSLSRTQSKRNYQTPNNRIAPNTYNVITPKVKPNTPQVLLRRPKQGEVAMSLQGSPLLTGAVVSETTANINIPLNDGQILSLQPKRGLRLSQIPQLDAETIHQLETLRDNLNKMCAANIQF